MKPLEEFLFLAKLILFSLTQLSQSNPAFLIRPVVMGDILLWWVCDLQRENRQDMQCSMPFLRLGFHHLRGILYIVILYVKAYYPRLLHVDTFCQD